MSSDKHKFHRTAITLAVATFLVLGTLVATYFARGYRLNSGQGLASIQGTGLLSATSHPKAAQVFIDDKLVTATEDTLNLPPGEYDVKITKEGFLPWQKKLSIEAELVTVTDARLFPAVPSLAALTYSGAQNPTPSPDGKKIAFIVTNADEFSKNGLYVTDINNGLLNLNRTPTLLAANTDRFDLTQALLVWSPDSKEILVTFTQGEDEEARISNTFLLETNDDTSLNSAPDVTLRLSLIFSQWEEDLIRNETALLKELPDFMYELATSSAQNVYFSPDGEKMLYTSTKELTIPKELVPPLDSINSSPQDRDLQPNHRYIYDLKEDTNYHIGKSTDSNSPKILLTPPAPSASESTATNSSTTQPIVYKQLQENKTPLETILAFKTHYTALFTNNPQWYPTSRHLISTADNKITIFEYDNNNSTSIYSGPFDASFVYPSPNGDRLIILTNLNQDGQPLNLYTLDLK